MAIRHLLAAAALILAAGNSHANLISNGGFEDGLTGWTCTTAANGGCFGEQPSDIDAYEGNSSFFGFSNGGLGTLSQGFANAAGATYSISLAFSTNDQLENPTSNSLILSVGDLSTNLALVIGQWSTFSSNFIANSTFSTVDFGFSTKPGTGTVRIDAVVVTLVRDPTPVPVPTPLVLIGLGLAGLGLSRRRKV